MQKGRAQWPCLSPTDRLAPSLRLSIWLLGLDLNQRPSAHEADELPDCSTQR